MAVQDVLMQNDIAHRLSPSEASWLVMVQDMTVKRLGFIVVRTPTNLTDTFMSSQETKISVLEIKWDRPSQAGRLRIWQVFDRTEQDKDGTGKDGDFFLFLQVFNELLKKFPSYFSEFLSLGL